MYCRLITSQRFAVTVVCFVLTLFITVISVDGQDRIIRGIVRRLDGGELTAAAATALQPGVVNFDVTVRGQVVGAGNATIGRPILGVYNAGSGEYSINVPPPPGEQNLRIDLTMQPNTSGFQTVSLARIALANQNIDVVMPVNTANVTSCCCRRCLFRRHR
jgi:hypothetical protein